MQEKTVTIMNPTGLHARPAAQFVRLANTFQSSLKVVYKGRPVNAKSMIEMMLAAAGRGEQIVIQAEGPDAELALNALENLLTKGLEE